MARRVAGPDDKVNVIFDVVLYPLERLVDQGKGRVAAGCFCSVDAGGATLAMACGVGCGARVCLVEWVGMEVWAVTLAGGRRGPWAIRGLAGVPVIWRKRPVSLRRPLAWLLASTASGWRLLGVSPTALLGGAALAWCPQSSRPQTSASFVRSIPMASERESQSSSLHRVSGGCRATV